MRRSVPRIVRFLGGPVAALVVAVAPGTCFGMPDRGTSPSALLSPPAGASIAGREKAEVPDPLRLAITAYNLAVERAAENPQGAVDLLDCAVSLHPDFPRAFYNRAVLHAGLGHLRRARADYAETIRLEPGCYEALVGRASVLARQGQTGEAIADLDAALCARPGGYRALVNRGVVHLMRNNFGRAIRDCSAATAAKPWRVEAFTARGNAFLSLGDYRRAMADCDRAIGIDPRHAPAHAIRGLARLFSGDEAGATADLGEAYRLDPAARLWAAARRAELEDRGPGSSPDR